MLATARRIKDLHGHRSKEIAGRLPVLTIPIPGHRETVIIYLTGIILVFLMDGQVDYSKLIKMAA